jgi:hypothetical protein
MTSTFPVFALLSDRLGTQTRKGYQLTSSANSDISTSASSPSERPICTDDARLQIPMGSLSCATRLSLSHNRTLVDIMAFRDPLASQANIHLQHADISSSCSSAVIHEGIDTTQFLRNGVLASSGPGAETADKFPLEPSPVTVGVPKSYTRYQETSSGPDLDEPMTSPCIVLVPARAHITTGHTQTPAEQCRSDRFAWVLYSPWCSGPRYTACRPG